MNCAQARFLLYAYLDREISTSEAEALSRHLAECPSCEARSRSARGVVRILRSRVERSPAPLRLRERLHQGEVYPARFRYPIAATAAVVLFLLVPLVADVASPVAGPAGGAPVALASLTAARPALALQALPVIRNMSGTLVCLDCEAREEAGLCPLPHAHHEAALCADNGEVWRLMPSDPSFTQRSAGQTLTVEGVAFPQSGFLRASRVGY
jgi:anti-sigma factor (TIGR02949 family)